MSVVFSHVSRTDFDQLYATSNDPWHIEHRWYERRKRALILAALPFETAELIVEPGCGTGVLSELLAQRCRRLMACDISMAAVVMARQRLAATSHVQFSCLEIPAQWPSVAPQSADCIIVNELGYYIAPANFPCLLERIAATLKPDGILVACHWKRAFLERTLPTATIHDTLAAGLALQSILHHSEQDFLLDVWSKDGRSVAAREGFA